ncbi:hypothetical protein XENTR_v10002988 [Xenopus tropicalis]|uniref:Tetratricopeptide repeat protein 33 isoform X2 n=1 Tax=Xenopus tropicalis TaxID=8364 RepID=A0A8J1IZW7_XENTR|nr:tetratricopeptide repeat protein 33 isoform X2 [Xenopus tropicalis]KAE8636426.1 hypothetical protein XENTR_v10002988 [Xenopus tropicalis]KAE8636427.1 hypothetical protein XENTR_v10002988 [Xenopus tropicalis]|eukprot:XP_017946336.1 PREDICTED: tetratricopeptide repeat protein 33 isoform X2 [Xenopus tropicalis]
MASFGWKRKIGEKVSKAVSQHFEEEAADESVVLDSHEVDWLHAIKRKKGILLEDNTARSKRLKEEGSLLAEDGRHKEALTKWDEAIQLTPEDAALYEMKAQAIRSFQIGLHICPANTELWEQDLNWARQLLQQKPDTESAEAAERKRGDITRELIPDYDFESDEVVAACDAISQRHKMAAANKAIVVSASGSGDPAVRKEENMETNDSKEFIKAR